jgi:three-Cys-motif partner protein
VLDPYGLHLDWKVIAQAGRMKSIELFLNFPVADINRNVLWRDPEGVTDAQRARLTRFWGDDSWKQAAYAPARQHGLFGSQPDEKVSNEEVAEAFRRRLNEVADFAHVPAPVAMRNSKNAVVYYLFFASQKPVAGEIVEQIFRKYRDRAA